MRSQTSTIELTSRSSVSSYQTTDALINTVRSATAVDLRRHFAVKSVYSNTSAMYVKQKFALRATSSYRFKSKTPLINIKSPYPHIEG